MNSQAHAERALEKTVFLAEIFGMCETADGKGYNDRPVHLTEEGRSGLETILKEIAEDISLSLDGDDVAGEHV